MANKPGLSGPPAKTEPEEPPPPPAPSAGQLVVYFDRSKGRFYTAGDKGSYQGTERDLLTIELRKIGYHRKSPNAWSLSPLEEEMLRISKEMSVDYAGPIGGYAVGLHSMFSAKVLVTTGPEFIQPKEGKFTYLGKFLNDLLGDQKKYFCGWLKWALITLKKGAPWSPGQALALAGPVNCGKSLLQSLITPILGNRASKPYAYLVGRDKYNAEVFAAEHGIIGDEVPLLDIRSRRNFGSALKNLIVTKEQSVRGMYKEPVTLTPFLRVSISLNDDPESLLALPPLDSDVKDKLMILKVSPAAFPWPSDRFPDSNAYFRQLKTELPAFLFWLLRWRVPESIKHQRYGIASYHHPDLVKSVDDLSPEWRLWELVVHHLGDGLNDREWTGSALDLVRALREADRNREVDDVCRWDTACGQFLGKLAHKTPDRVSAAVGAQNKKLYTLLIPANGRKL